MAGEILQWVQIGLSALTMLGGAFALGRVFERMTAFQEGQKEIKVALFGPDGQGGVFLRRAEAELMLQSANSQRAAQNSRLEELSTRLHAVEARGS